jgi:transcriptional regulator with XRE-family HTH domain
MPKTIKIKTVAINKTYIARVMGITPQYAHELMSGKKNNPESLDKLKRVIKQEFGIPMHCDIEFIKAEET